MRGKVEESVMPHFKGMGLNLQCSVSGQYSRHCSSVKIFNIVNIVNIFQCPSPAALIVSIFYISTYFAYSTCTAGLATIVSTDKDKTSLINTRMLSTLKAYSVLAFVCTLKLQKWDYVSKFEFGGELRSKFNFVRIKLHAQDISPLD